MAEQQKERFDQPHDFDQYLGHLDLELHPKWEQAWKGQDQKVFEEILKDMGADLRYGYDFRVCNYRPRTSKHSEYGIRIGFKERSDKWWVDNMMDITDIIRHVKGSVRTTGMRLSIPEDSSLYEVMAQQAAKFAVVVDIKCNEGEVKA